MDAMSSEFKYRVTNTSDEVKRMDDDGLQRRFAPGQTKKTRSKPDGRESGWEWENLNPETSDIEDKEDSESEEE